MKVLAPQKIALVKFWNLFKEIIQKINFTLLLIGSLFSLFLALIIPQILNYLVLLFYIILLILRIILDRTSVRSWGEVKDMVSRLPLSLAIVRIFNEKENFLMATKVTDEKGKFNFLISKGGYYLTCVKGGYKPYQSETLDIKKEGIIKMDVKMEREGGS